MSLMLLNQAELFSNRGAIGEDHGTRVSISKNGNIAVSYFDGGTVGASINLYRKVNNSWVLVRTESTFTYGRKVKLSGDGTKLAFAQSPSNTFYPRSIFVYNIDPSTLELTLLTTVNAGTNIWYFDVNNSGVVYTTTGSSLRLFRFSDLSTQTISFAEIDGISEAWFNDDSSLNFKWSGADSTGVYSIGTVSVVNASTFTRTVVQTNLQPSYGENSDFSRDVFSYVGLAGDAPSFFVVNSLFLQTFTLQGYFGLPNGWFISQVKISDNGELIAVLLYNSFGYNNSRIYLLSKGSSNFSIIGYYEFLRRVTDDRQEFATDSTLRDFLVQTNAGPSYSLV